MTKSAQVKIAKEISRVSDHAYLDAVVKQAATRGVVINSQEDMSSFLKIASMLRDLKTRMSSAIVQAAAEDLDAYNAQA